MYQYTKLTVGEKADLIWRKGVFIDSYTDSKTTVNLYYLYHFYVEVIVSHRLSQITEITPFKKGERFDKYLQNISIRELSSS